MTEPVKSRWKMTGDVMEALQFFNSIMPLTASADMKAICLKKDDQMVASVIYQGYNGQNVWMHVAAQPGSRWMTREYLRYCFYYPFVELGVKRVSGHVDANNAMARRMDEHLGFKQEAVLKGAAHDGGDVILYVMWREGCRHVDPQ